VGDAFIAARSERRNFRTELKYLNFEAIISQIGPISSGVAPRVIDVESEQDGQ